MTTPPTVRPHGGHETVLLVEDEPVVRELTRLVLERAGYTVLEAANSDEAESAFCSQTDRIDLLLTDVMMPGRTGPDLFARLAGIKPHLRVLFMSGYTDMAALDVAAFEREADFLQKPFSAAGLVQKVREVLDR